MNEKFSLAQFLDHLSVSDGNSSYLEVYEYFQPKPRMELVDGPGHAKIEQFVPAAQCPFFDKKIELQRRYLPEMLRLLKGAEWVATGIIGSQPRREIEPQIWGRASPHFIFNTLHPWTDIQISKAVPSDPLIQIVRAIEAFCRENDPIEYTRDEVCAFISESERCTVTLAKDVWLMAEKDEAWSKRGRKPGKTRDRRK